MRKTNRGTYMWKNIVVWKRKGSFKGDFVIRGSVDTWTNWIAKELLPTERKPMRATLRCLVWAIFLFLLPLSRVSFPNQIFCKGKEIFWLIFFFSLFFFGFDLWLQIVTNQFSLKCFSDTWKGCRATKAASCLLWSWKQRREVKILHLCNILKAS